ncbi:hypothetical protein J4229_03825 [Candidatus Pacearchaeota archaeon]|nr:hypothetical protein [Candidatus Pacearchaeota archaeon]
MTVQEYFQNSKILEGIVEVDKLKQGSLIRYKVKGKHEDVLVFDEIKPSYNPLIEDSAVFIYRLGKDIMGYVRLPIIAKNNQRVIDFDNIDFRQGGVYSNVVDAVDNTAYTKRDKMLRRQGL